MKTPRKDMLDERGGRIDPKKDDREPPLDKEERVDEAIAESFPASDPPSWTAGVDEEEEKDKEEGKEEGERKQ